MLYANRNSYSVTIKMGNIVKLTLYCHLWVAISLFKSMSTTSSQHFYAFTNMNEIVN